MKYNQRKTRENLMPIDESNFEGTLVLEKLAEIDQLDAFYDAVDSDNFGKAMSLMKRAGIDSQTIALVLKKMSAGD
jgi:hypothetical protein